MQDDCSGYSYKHAMIKVYDSRVVHEVNCSSTVTVESKITIEACLFDSPLMCSYIDKWHLLKVYILHRVFGKPNVTEYTLISKRIIL